MNLKPTEYQRLTLRQFYLMQQGHERRVAMQIDLNNEAWKQARFIAYNAIRPHIKNQHLSITDFMPLPCDPVLDMNAAEKEAKAAIERYTKAGLLKPNATA